MRANQVLCAYLTGFDAPGRPLGPEDQLLMEARQRQLLAMYGPAALGGAGPPGSHLPGIYPPASLSSDLLARERERQDRLALGEGN